MAAHWTIWSYTRDIPPLEWREISVDDQKIFFPSLLNDSKKKCENKRYSRCRSAVGLGVSRTNADS